MTCKETTQAARKCHSDSWENTPGKGAAHFPIKLIDYTGGHLFCPAKLWRDDMSFALYLEHLFTGWKTGQGKPIDQMDTEEFDDLYLLIREWTNIERENGYFRIGMMIGGDPDKKDNPKSGADMRGS